MQSAKSWAASVRDLFDRHRTLIVYGAIGIVGATLDFLVYTALVLWADMWPVAATVVSVTLGIANNFLMNARWNFRVDDSLWRRWWMFYFVGLTGVVISALAIWALVEWTPTGPLMAKLISIPPVVLAQFIANRRFSFAPTSVPEAVSP
jgi:putative flippase GtrA